MHRFHRRGRGLVALASVALTLPLTAALSPAAAATTPAAPTSAPYALVPQPVSQQAVPGAGFTLTPRTRIAVLSKDAAAQG
ncbi:hypothetical protein VR45_40195, partial [Streptomyces sp. NRRL S-495]